MELKKRALILVSHGSKRTTWLRPFEAIREETDRELREELGTTVGLSVLEGLGKTLSEAVHEAVEAGASSIAVFPLFLTASTHLAEDVPELVGQVREEFGPELSIELLTNEPLHTRIWENTRRRLDAHKTDSSTTWIVAPYYGSDRYAAAWTDLLETASDSVQHWGFAGFTAAPIGHIVGASPIPTRDAVRAGLTTARSVIVLPLLLSAGIFQHEKIPAALADLQSAERDRVLYTPDGILPDPGIAEWIVTETKKWLHPANGTTSS